MRFLAMLLTVLLLIVGGKLCLTGDKMYDDAQVFATPEHLDYAKFASERPLVGWYQISGATVDITEGAYHSTQVNSDPEFRPTLEDLQRLHRATDAYVPVHDETLPSSPADIILHTRDPDLLQAVKSNADRADAAIHVCAPRIVKGMLSSPSELPDRIRRVLGNCITTQSIIVEEYAAPSAPRAIATMAGGGALLLACAILWLIIWKQDRNRIVVPDEFIPDDLMLEEDI